jgi:hypothetical protein
LAQSTTMTCNGKILLGSLGCRYPDHLMHMMGL